ncbi:MAG: four helix bundle protein [Planctomycetes bacterium]|nr:four helix bundle protein [Planctomycetota bacterium]
MPPLRHFDFEKLYVFQRSLDLAVEIDRIADALPPRRAYLADQIRRAASSVTLNIGEGAGEFARREKGRFYRYARRSATETAAAVVLIEKLKLAEPHLTELAREHLFHVISMLTALANAQAPRLQRQVKEKGKVKVKGPSASPPVQRPPDSAKTA